MPPAFSMAPPPAAWLAENVLLVTVNAPELLKMAPPCTVPVGGPPPKVWLVENVLLVMVNVSVAPEFTLKISYAFVPSNVMACPLPSIDKLPGEVFAIAGRALLSVIVPGPVVASVAIQRVEQRMKRELEFAAEVKALQRRLAKLGKALKAV